MKWRSAARPRVCAASVDWEFFSLDGNDICRGSIDPSDHPVIEAKSDDTYCWWRTPVSTDNVADADERDRLIARRWKS